MVICRNCEHENPEGATICETCYTPISISDADDNVKCPNCGSETLRESTFCGQCGSKLEVVGNDVDDDEPPRNMLDKQDDKPDSPEQVVSENKENQSTDESSLSSQSENDVVLPIESEDKIEGESNETQIQSQKVSLFHIQTKTEIDIPLNLSVIHVGKINGRVPPDIDVSGFPDSQIVSRVHADIIRESNNFYIEDTGSANGTYINHIPLPTGDRHKLQNDDRIALGKEDKVSFIFKITEK